MGGTLSNWSFVSECNNIHHYNEEEYRNHHHHHHHNDWWTWSRKDNPDTRGTSLLGRKGRIIIVETAVQLLWLLVLVRTRDWRLLPYFVLWFPGLWAVEWAKVNQVWDVHCSVTRETGNGVSGHFFYFAWALSSAIKLWDVLPWNPQWVFGTMCIVFAWQGSLTWLYGYHSLRQCMFGASLGIIWALVTWTLCEKGLGRRRVE